MCTAQPYVSLLAPPLCVSSPFTRCRRPHAMPRHTAGSSTHMREAEGPLRPRPARRSARRARVGALTYPYQYNIVYGPSVLSVFEPSLVLAASLALASRRMAFANRRMPAFIRLRTMPCTKGLVTRATFHCCTGGGSV